MLSVIFVVLPLLYIIYVIYLIHKHCIKEKRRRRREEAVNLILRAPNLAEVFRLTHTHRNVLIRENLIPHERNSVHIESNNLREHSVIGMHPGECEDHIQIISSENVQPNIQQLDLLDLPPSYSDELPPTYSECFSYAKH